MYLPAVGTTWAYSRRLLSPQATDFCQAGATSTDPESSEPQLWTADGQAEAEIPLHRSAPWVLVLK